MLIYQAENGTTNADKSPVGGVINQSSVAESMAISIGNPITFYGVSAVINQDGHSGDLFDYYWTSYSRGTDGRYVSGAISEPQWHNDYLDGYIPLRVKSIYDPCPYLYRIPSNGSWNQFRSNAGWTGGSYLGGASFNINTEMSWLPALGWRIGWASAFEHTGYYGFYFSSTTASQTNVYVFLFHADKGIWPNRNNHTRSLGHSVRCIDEGRKSFRKYDQKRSSKAVSCHV